MMETCVRYCIAVCSRDGNYVGSCHKKIVTANTFSGLCDVVILILISSHFLIPLPDFTLICTVPMLLLVIHYLSILSESCFFLFSHIHCYLYCFMCVYFAVPFMFLCCFLRNK